MTMRGKDAHTGRSLDRRQFNKLAVAGAGVALFAPGALRAQAKGVTAGQVFALHAAVKVAPQRGGTGQGAVRRGGLPPIRTLGRGTVDHDETPEGVVTTASNASRRRSTSAANPGTRATAAARSPSRAVSSTCLAHS